MLCFLFQLARRVFHVAHHSGFTTGGYAWFITEDVLSRNEDVLDDYPVGLLALTLDYSYDFKVQLVCQSIASFDFKVWLFLSDNLILSP